MSLLLLLTPALVGKSCLPKRRLEWPPSEKLEIVALFHVHPPRSYVLKYERSNSAPPSL